MDTDTQEPKWTAESAAIHGNETPISKKGRDQIKKKHPIRVTLFAIILVVVVTFGINMMISIAAENRRVKETNELFSLGIRYLTEMDYEAAVVCLDQILEIDEKKVAAYVGAALAYDQLRERELAI